MIGMRRSSSLFLVTGIGIILLIAGGALLIIAGVTSLAHGGLPDIDSIFGPRSGATLTITGALVNTKTGETVAAWDAPQGPLAIMFGNTRIDVDPSQGSYQLEFTPKWDVRVANISEDQWTVKVTVTSVTQSWKGVALNDVTPIGVSNTAQATKSKSDTAVNLTCAKRVFGCDYVVSNPPPVGGSADYKITYNYKVELYVGNTLVDSKTGQATATATFTNTISGTLSSISVSVQPVTAFTPLYIGF